MSDTDDVAGLGHHALRTARVEGLRRRMEEFVTKHDRGVELHEIRSKTEGGTPLSELVDEERNERI